MYDASRSALVYLGDEATQSFWDTRWEIPDHALGRLLDDPPRSYVTWTTRRYLRPDGARLLEGGCGRGQHVAALARAGYACVGLDSAPQTVASIQRVAPQLDVREGDVRSLPFADASFDGYWSIGVIEHFWDGYASILAEAARVLRPGGYFFLVYPHMSPARRCRAWLGGFEKHRGDRPSGFYQFALSADQVRIDTLDAGFDFVSRRTRGGLIGLDEELSFDRLTRLLRGKHLHQRLLRGAANMGLAPVFGHTVVDVYRAAGKRTAR